MVRRVRLAVLGLACALAAFAVVPGAASAVQHSNGHNYAFWSWSGSGFWNVDQLVRIDEKARTTFWAEQFFWSGTSTGGYMGLQTDGNRVDGSRGDTAIFSVWGANAARGACRTFAGEGTGYQCLIPYRVATNRLYRYRIWRLDADAGGQWWGAWMIDPTTGQETWIGSIRAAASNTTIGATTNFVEYFGAKVACTQVPRSNALFTQPAANSMGGGVYEYGSSYAGNSKGSCVTSTATADASLGWTRGVRIVLGSRRPEATRVLYIHGFEREGSNSCEGTWGEMLDAHRTLGWTGGRTVLTYYADDTRCDAHAALSHADIGASGSHTQVNPSGHVTRNRRIVGHSTDARIDHLAHHMAWTIYDRYTRFGIPVKVVGHSMGGLITRSAIKETQVAREGFPPRLLVEDVVTLGTPHTGTGKANICAPTHGQCRDLRPDSDFLNDLSRHGQNPQGDGITEWSTYGADYEGTTTSRSATGMTAADKVVYARGQGIKHGDYMHKKTGAALYATDARVTVRHYDRTCPFTRTFWPVTLTFVALREPTDPC